MDNDKSSRRNFSPNQKFILMSLYMKNKHPSKEDKIKVAVKACLTFRQVDQWFTNARRRYMQPADLQEEEIKSSSSSDNFLKEISVQKPTLKKRRCVKKLIDVSRQKLIEDKENNLVRYPAYFLKEKDKDCIGTQNNCVPPGFGAMADAASRGLAMPACMGTSGFSGLQFPSISDVTNVPAGDLEMSDSMVFSSLTGFPGCKCPKNFIHIHEDNFSSPKITTDVAHIATKAFQMSTCMTDSNPFRFSGANINNQGNFSTPGTSTPVPHAANGDLKMFTSMAYSSPIGFSETSINSQEDMLFTTAISADVTNVATRDLEMSNGISYFNPVGFSGTSMNFHDEKFSTTEISTDVTNVTAGHLGMSTYMAYFSPTGFSETSMNIQEEKFSTTGISVGVTDVATKDLGVSTYMEYSSPTGFVETSMKIPENFSTVQSNIDAAHIVQNNYNDSTRSTNFGNLTVQPGCSRDRSYTVNYVKCDMNDLLIPLADGFEKGDPLQQFHSYSPENIEKEHGSVGDQVFGPEINLPQLSQDMDDFCRFIDIIVGHNQDT